MMDVKKQVASGQDAHCFVKYLIDGQKESGITDQEIAFLAGVMVSALSRMSVHNSDKFFDSTALVPTRHPMLSPPSL